MGEQVAARFLKNLLVDFEGTKQVWQYGSGRCTLKTAHRKFFLKEKRHQISMIRKSFYITVHLDSSERRITKNITKAASKQAYAVLFRFCCMAEQLSKILPIASRKTKT